MLLTSVLDENCICCVICLEQKKNITQSGGGHRMQERDLKTIALQISSLLPKDREEANKVITHLQSLVDNWLFLEEKSGGGGNC